LRPRGATVIVCDTAEPSACSVLTRSAALQCSRATANSQDVNSITRLGVIPLRGWCSLYVHVCRRRSPRVPLVALDMDGTLLDSSSNISPDSAHVIRAATAAGVQVILATGKARPAAIAAARKAHLEGDALLVSHRKPGVFLQVGSGAPFCEQSLLYSCAHSEQQLLVRRTLAVAPCHLAPQQHAAAVRHCQPKCVCGG
jgi:hypothetical protein